MTEQQQTFTAVSVTGFLTLKKYGMAVEKYHCVLDYEGWLCSFSMSFHPRGPSPAYRSGLPVIVSGAGLLFVCSDTLSARSCPFISFFCFFQSY